MDGRKRRVVVGREGGKALCSWRVPSLAVGAGSSLSRSPGRGRGNLRHQSRALGRTASPGHGGKKHLTLSFSASQALCDILS